MNKLGIYIALSYVLLYTQSALQNYGISPQPPPVLFDRTAKTKKNW